MTEGVLSLWQRLVLAATLFRRCAGDPELAARARPLLDGPAAAGEPDPGPAVQVLGLLQRHGRLIDFLQEEVAEYSDQQVGVAARVVHQGCRQVLEDYFQVQPVRSEPEGSRIQVAEGFDPDALRLSGHLVGQAPFSGRLVHRGWRATGVRLPRLAPGSDPHILAPAEVEL
jgi:hypothetical protein